MGNAPLDPPPGTRHHSRFFSDNNVSSRQLRMEMDNDENEGGTTITRGAGVGGGGGSNSNRNGKSYRDDDIDDDLDDNGNDYDTIAGSKLDHLDFDIHANFSPTSHAKGSFFQDDEDDEEERKKEADNHALAAHLTNDSSLSSSYHDIKYDDDSSSNNNINNDIKTETPKQPRPHKRSVTLPTYIRRRSSLLLTEAKNRVGALVGSKKTESSGDTSSVPSVTSATSFKSTPSDQSSSTGNNNKKMQVKTPQSLPPLSTQSDNNKADVVQLQRASSTPASSTLPPLPPKLTTQSSVGDVQLSLNTRVDPKDNTFTLPEGARHTRKSSVCSEEASQIRPFLYLGGDLVAKNRELLKILKVTNVINAARSVCDNYYEKDGIEYLSYDLLDAPDEQICNFFLKTIHEIEKVKKKHGVILVHCQHGVSRSSTLLIAYLMWADKLGYEEAFRTMKQLRTICCPNVGFMMQLKDWERVLTLPPVKPVFFRIGPHSDREKSLVARPMLSASSSSSSKPPTPSPMSKGKDNAFSEPSSDTNTQSTPAATESSQHKLTSAPSGRRASITFSNDVVAATSSATATEQTNSAAATATAAQLPAPGMAVRRSRARSITVKPPVKFSIQNINKKEVYILHVPDTNYTFLWIGKECPKLEEYSASAHSHCSLMLELVPVLKDYKVIRVASQSKEEAERTLSSSSNPQQKTQAEQELLFWKSLDGIEVSESEQQ